MFLVHSNQDDNAKRFESQRYYLPRGIIKNYNIIINRKKLYVPGCVGQFKNPGDAIVANESMFDLTI